MTRHLRSPLWLICTFVPRCSLLFGSKYAPPMRLYDTTDVLRAVLRRKGPGDLNATVEDAHAKMREVLGKEEEEVRWRQVMGGRGESEERWRQVQRMGGEGGMVRGKQRGGWKGRRGRGDLKATVEDAHARMREVLSKEEAEAGR